VQLEGVSVEPVAEALDSIAPVEVLSEVGVVTTPDSVAEEYPVAGSVVVPWAASGKP